MTMENTSSTSLGNSSDSSSSNSLFAFGIFVELIFVWTIVGNSIIIAVLKLYKPLTIPDILVFSLALSDLLNVLLPAQILNLIQSHFFNLTWSKSTCAAFTVLVYCFRLSSVLTVSVIALDRLIAIRRPLLYRARVMHEIGRVKVLILVLWLFSCFTASLPFMGVSDWSFKDNECPYQLLDLGIYYGFCVEILGLLQLALVLYCYIAIRISTWHFLKRQGKFRRAQLNRTMSNPPQNNHDEDKAEANRSPMNRQGSKVELTTEASTERHNASPRYGQKARRGSFIKQIGSKRRSSSTPFLTEGMKQVAKMEKMMAVLVFLFYLTWIPFLGSNLYSLITKKSNGTVTKIIGVFSLINGFLNPIVYATIYPRYRKGYVFVFRTILRICGGKKPSISTADFDSSKIGRSRRLQTLKELKLSTVKENETSRIRQGWMGQTSSTSAMITEEHAIENQLAGNDDDKSTLRNGNAALSCFEKDVETSKFGIECKPENENEGRMHHIAADCLVANCVECNDKQANGCTNEVRNVVSPTFVEIANVSSNESTGQMCYTSDTVQRQQLKTDSNIFMKHKMKWSPKQQDSSCGNKDVRNSNIELTCYLASRDHMGYDGDDNFNNIVRSTQSSDAFEEMKNYSDMGAKEEKCFQILPNSACVNDGFLDT